MISEDKRATSRSSLKLTENRLAHVVAFLAIVALIAWVQARDAPHWRAFLATLIFFVIVIVAYFAHRSRTNVDPKALERSGTVT